ncbi:sperm motility kinase 2B-like [Saccostrea echinata]|uniref:sperm motility kinase 2B-like n=1 Tax=Saccostrea echinata TaxID=191078 RepID=UPI002A827645|nr:sperm motility kinase 2B-like [Saccostrea echinata]
MEENTYIILRKIDEGAFVDIFCVQRLKDHKLLAMKQILYRGDISRDPYITQELNNLSNIKHEYIIMLLEAIITDKSVNLIMELAENGNLEDLVSGNKLDSDQLSVILKQLLTALNFCHKSKIAHRDVTPYNILLTKEMSVRLADFGLSVPCRDSEDKIILCDDYLGHLHYTAPEVLMKTPYDPLRSDMWSLGIIAYFMIHSTVPFVGEEEDIVSQQTDDRIVNETISRAHEFNDTLFGIFKVVMKNVLRAIPEKRCQTGDLLKLINNEA